MRTTTPPHYVVLGDSLGPIYHIKAQRGGEKFSGISNSTVSTGEKSGQLVKVNTFNLEIFNLLIPFARIKQLKSFVGKDNTSFAKGDTLLITMSLLPYKSGNILWSRIELDTIPSERLYSISNIVKKGFLRVNSYRKAGSPGSHALLCQDNLKPVVNWQRKHWTPSAYVLTEYFQVRSYATKLFSQTDMATINIRGPYLTKESLLQANACIQAIRTHNYWPSHPVIHFRDIAKVTMNFGRTRV